MLVRVPWWRMVGHIHDKMDEGEKLMVQNIGEAELRYVRT
jgi:hypothetical protein